jgi:phage protein D
MAKLVTYAPEYLVKINGDPLPAAIRGSIVRLSHQDGIEGADRVEMTVANPSLRFLDHPLLAVDNSFQLAIGYAPGPLEIVFTGTITGVETTFPSSGMPVLRVTAQDALQDLQKGKKNRAFRITIPTIGNFPLPDVLVTSIVAGLDGLIPLIDPVGGALSTLMTLATFLAFPQFAQQSVRRQSGQTDFDFLTTVAHANGWQMSIDHSMDPRGRVLKFTFLMQDYTPSTTLRWGSSLVDFSPRLTTVGDIFGVEARVWVDTLKMEFVIAVSWDYDRAALNLTIFPSMIGDVDQILGSAARGKMLSVQPTGYATAPQKILTELLPRLNSRLTGSGNAVGNPEIKSGKVVRFEGLGSQFSGLYRITGVNNSIDSSGYKTSFQARKEVWFGSVPLPQSTSGLARLQGQFSV